MSNGNLDFDRVAAFLTMHGISSTTDLAKRVVMRAQRKFTRASVKAIDLYYQGAIDKHTHCKPFLTPDRRRSLDDIYVPVPLRSHDNHIAEPDASDFCTNGTKAILIGRAGSGKSTLLQHVLADAISHGEKIPVLVRLRNIEADALPSGDGTTQTKHPTLFGYIFHALREFGGDLQDGELHKLLEEGCFLILLDGLDEVVPSARSFVRAQIEQLLQRYRYNDSVVTSRPGDEFRDWTSWVQYIVEGLSKESAKQLVERSEYRDDDLVKLRSFLDLFDSRLYEYQYEFASNPLLLSLMYMSFYSYGNIPDRLYTFYTSAFHVLWERHDAGKDGFYKRYRYSTRDVSLILAIIEDLAAQAQDDNTYDLDDELLRQFLENAKAAEKAEFDIEDIKNDLVEGLSLLLADGLYYRFIHRSFQDYFSARYLQRISPEARERVKSRLLEGSRDDQVLEFLGENSPALLERDILIPYGQVIFDRFLGEDDLPSYRKYLEYMVKRVRLSAGPINIVYRLELQNYARIVSKHVNRRKTDNGETGAKVTAKEANPNAEQRFREVLCSASYPGRHADDLLIGLDAKPLDIDVEVFAALADDHQSYFERYAVPLSEKYFRRCWENFLALKQQYQEREKRLEAMFGNR